MGASAEALTAAAAAETAAADPVIAAAGDIACDPANSNFNSGNGNSNSCRQKAVSDLIFNRGYDAVLLLGDNQYYCGGYTAHVQSYDLSWGRFKNITKPAPGNHEYITSGGTDCNSANAGADGYYRYFGAAAGEKGKGYYSFDVGAWHIIALNSHCSGAGGCSSSTQQGQWLRNELQTHANVCTLAYWHVPLYSSGGRDDSTYRTFWDALYQHGADVVLSGHDHTYERFARQNPTGGLDNTRGIRQFVVGTGGANHTSFVTTMANSEARDDSTFGILKLTLHPTSYDWEFIPEAGKSYTDSGTQSCHGAADDTTPPSTPTGLTATASGPSKVDLSWNASTDNRGVAGYRVRRNGSLIATLTTGTSYSDTTVNPATTYSYTVDAYDGGLNYSAQSAPRSVTTPPDTTAPTAPTNLTAADVTASQVRLTWTASTDNVGVHQYRIFRGGVEIGTSTTPSYTDTSVAPLTPYSYFVRAYDVSNNASPASNTINVTTPARPTVMTFAPAADASIRADLPANNYGGDALLAVDMSPVADTLLKFNVNGLAGRSVVSAKLRLHALDGGGGGSFKRVANTSWLENTINWSNAPAADAATLATLGSVTAGTWYEIDLTSMITADGPYSVRISGTATNGADYGSKEGSAAQAPQLVVTAGGDTQPPSAPTGLSATAPSPTRVDLAWTASTDNVGVARYRIFRGGVQIATSTTNSYGDASVQPTTSYSYHVIAEDVSGNLSPASNTANVTTPADTSAPTAPTNLGATAVDAARVDLNWSPSSDNIGVTGYRISRNGTQIATSLMPTYSDTSVAASTSYSYVVRAVDAAGNVSPPSNTASVTTPAGAPTTLTFTPAADTTLRADLPTNNYGSLATMGIDSSPVEDLLLKFNVTGLGGSGVASAKLRIYCTDPGGVGGVFKRVGNSTWGEMTVNWGNAPAPDAATLATLGPVVAGTWYEIDVTSAVTGEGLVSFRASSSSTNGTDYSSKEGTAGFAPQLVVTAGGAPPETEPPSQPLNLMATAPSSNRVDLVWTGSTDNVGVTGYRIYRNGTLIGTSTTTGFADDTAQPSTAYGYHVIAYDAAGNSSIPSNTANITTPGDPTPPSAPTNLAGSVVSSTQVDLTWTASTDNVGVTGYRVFRNGTQIATPTGTSHSDTTAQPGSSYDYEVRAVDAAGNVSAASNVATVVTPSTSLLTFVPTADSMIQAAAPTTTGGTKTTISVDNEPVKHSLLKFTVTGVGSRPIRSVKLRLFCTNLSNVGGVVTRAASSSWSETTVTWNTAPAAGSTTATIGPVAVGNWYEVDVTSLITGDGTFSLRMSSTSADGADYYSREGTNPPQLVVDAG